MVSFFSSDLNKWPPTSWLLGPLKWSPRASALLSGCHRLSVFIFSTCVFSPWQQKARDNRAAQRINKVQFSNDPVKRQQATQPPLPAPYDPACMEVEGGFKDPLKSKESEQEQEWKLRQVRSAVADVKTWPHTEKSTLARHLSNSCVAVEVLQLASLACLACLIVDDSNAESVINLVTFQISLERWC